MARIIWSQLSLWQLDEIAEYIAQDSEFQTKQIVHRINAAIEQLKKSPELGAATPEFAEYKVREIHCFSYRIFYQLRNDKSVVQIVGIVHAARQLTDELITPSSANEINNTEIERQQVK